MDFKQLMTMRDEIGSLSSKRHRESDVSFLNGMNLLEKAYERQFQDKELLLKASEAFMQAIQNNRMNPDPYVGIAYLFLLLNNTNKAIRYLNEARRVAPSHENARLLLDSILEKEEIEKEMTGEVSEEQPFAETIAFAGDHLPVLGPDHDFDALYDDLEALLMEESRKLMDEPFDARPSLQAENLGPIEVRLTQLSKIYKHLDQQLSILDQEIDTSELRVRLRPLDVMKRRMEQVLSTTKSLQEIQSSSRLANKSAQQLFRTILSIQTREEAKLQEQSLEKLLDECDRIADMLDAISENGFSIAEIEDDYQQLVGTVETCQDLLDERNESLI
ncbi:hypothetical protein COW36_16925 [bacterium (Candidatus Blackallbacteria) CG17_big_fil_post_rev_8_21_14_2_50_48_46]|uniref:Uncharacterized protein n=1 Tax=bacterium (Candidatus Blackallbacteria) CG17_big_fil_post_rev_8_21_14_2_50_48_46 TaxID=2014261 RepID=A0A2M7G1J0_9BACT|nr:MAG: hypothetical protein COW64_09235 [bacterium (Candidatus Blackallbacteria) CG18_big_fil_WC_8_21_14_2_50_49_26]PIW15487.1 MAG: hypothetical protein COW36_16925 [bacterium (Candidatus Blackallbacteria) CG17_big_fil_post_rev_8_21_14_2_50_48_46]PIW48613.1 MAG: hypothetical protein COW20_08920 [bacterium (Candidatus Blackallbacteria) CG13_big_fil_rev_8_21_14_2_50_49_14]